MRLCGRGEIVSSSLPLPGDFRLKLWAVCDTLPVDLTQGLQLTNIDYGLSGREVLVMPS